MSNNDRRRRPLYAPPPPRSRSTLATYGPLILTVAIATAGAVAWIWADRRDSADDEDDPSRRAQAGPSSDRQSTGVVHQEGSRSLTSRVSDALSAGAAAVGSGVAAAGSTLGLTRSEHDDASATTRTDKGKRIAREDGFSDHERWSEEATNARAAPTKAPTSGKRKTVAIVVSAEHDFDGAEHTSILSHLPPNLSSSTELYVLIFAPHQSSPTAAALHDQALSLLPGKETNVLPFSTPTGYVHMLRHLAPSLAYVADTPALAGAGGETIGSLRGWVGQTVVIVGDDGAGGLVDTSEDEAGEGRDKWWEGSEMVGLGKGVEVVDVARVGDDWARRVGA